MTVGLRLVFGPAGAELPRLRDDADCHWEPFGVYRGMISEAWEEKNPGAQAG